MNLLQSPRRSNVELKARCDDLEQAHAVCDRVGAVDHGAVAQTDTYFTMGRYRLKIRECSDGKHCLIGYSRPDGPQARKSQYQMERVVAPRAVKATLARQWGIKVEVKKTRRVFLWQGRVRIHLDEVEGLGTFLEFEAVLDPDRPEYDEDAAHLDVARLSHDFGIEPRDLIASSYSTLVKQATQTPAGT